jgi:hypothetical protein
MRAFVVFVGLTVLSSCARAPAEPSPSSSISRSLSRISSSATSDLVWHEPLQAAAGDAGEVIRVTSTNACGAGVPDGYAFVVLRGGLAYWVGPKEVAQFERK